MAPPLPFRRGLRCRYIQACCAHHQACLAGQVIDKLFFDRGQLGAWTLVERDCPEKLWLHDVDWVQDEVQAFFSCTRGTTHLDDRVLATVMFTDIVGSTQQAASLGDRRWRSLLDEHDALTRREIERYRGRVVKSTGDGMLATFDGPARATRCAVALTDTVRQLGINSTIAVSGCSKAFRASGASLLSSSHRPGQANRVEASWSEGPGFWPLAFAPDLLAKGPGPRSVRRDVS